MVVAFSCASFARAIVLSNRSISDEGSSGRNVAAAITAARDAANLVFLIADTADWPQQLYGKLGFDPVGTYRQFTKPPPGETYR